ncbi:MAG: hypothetical protein CMJ76_01775 [Planctomycetaceae bacterium]|nr:hypothetical protein [Planctomycetaceae bacterium]
MNDDSEDRPQSGSVHANTVAARVSEGASRGVFSTGVVLLTGGSEFIVDFVQNLGSPTCVVSRVIIPHGAMHRIIDAIERNVEGHEDRYGPIVDGSTVAEPAAGQTEPNVKEKLTAEDLTSEQLVGIGESGATVGNDNSEPSAQDVYDDIRLEPEVENGVYANALMIGHSASEFKLDFIANLYPKSIVTSRIFLSAPQLMRVLQSMKRTYSQFVARRNTSQ